MVQLRTDLTNNPPLPGSFTPRKGDMCAGLFIDNLWYGPFLVSGFAVYIVFLCFS